MSSYFRSFSFDGLLPDLSTPPQRKTAQRNRSDYFVAQLPVAAAVR